ncbi:4-hydroxy-tetrahydrodipicolinate synthase [Agaribacterium haliotis]|uniref:4-hydroxy-tetrahydrodipicolinate synthase n=1 Tax=Agaribacterium haliotis TaxID=2013869 RepID=UPI000BB5914F|nr:4-hydroxy-tetrahydrodipicolinate synthase [Agaribacterium haliotis]
MFRGSLVALVTPMKADTSLDWDALDKLVEWHLEQGTHGIVAMGTTGESATLDREEHLAVIRRVIDVVNKRVPVIAGTGANSTREALDLTASAKDAGADAALLVTPYYNKPSQEGLFLHHQYIAERVALPQLLYNVPGRTAVDMGPEVVERLSMLEHIVGIKEATGDLQRLADIKARVSDDFCLLSGDDETGLAFMEAGGHGVISVTTNVAPRLMSQICELALGNDFSAAQALDARLQSVHKNLFLESNPIPVKWAVSQLGFGANALRLPLTGFEQGLQPQLRAAMQENGLI